MSIIKVDLNKCVGCRSCELACSYHHRKVFFPEISSIQIYFDSQYNIDVSILNSCDCKSDPPCVKICPTKAILFFTETKEKIQKSIGKAY